MTVTLQYHKEFPIEKPRLKLIITDLRKLYPECDAVFLVGTYARLNEQPSKDKEHDVDLLIHFPARSDRKAIELRNDDKLWRKWSSLKARPVIDFLFMFGKEESKYGQHIWNRSHGKNTPKLLVWRK
jgi:predicted nucleotidyltransferase